MGTPGFAKAGLWFEISTGLKRAYQRFHWTLLDNPHVPGEEELRRVRERRGIDDKDPSYRREYLGEWAVDESKLVYPYSSVHPIPESWKLNDPTWIARELTCSMGIDFGWNDSMAWVVVGSAGDDEGTTYVIDCHKGNRILPDDVVEITKGLIEKWGPVRVVGDSGGGKLTIEGFNAAWGDSLGVYIEPAQKADKAGSIAQVNAEMRAGRLRLTDRSIPVHKEMSELPWKNDLRKEEHPAHDNHLCDALRYAVRAHVRSQTTPKKLGGRNTSFDEQELQEWHNAQVRREMENLADPWGVDNWTND